MVAESCYVCRYIKDARIDHTYAQEGFGALEEICLCSRLRQTPLLTASYMQELGIRYISEVENSFRKVQL